MIKSASRENLALTLNPKKMAAEDHVGYGCRLKGYLFPI
jgi:hypothetical protein